MNLLITGAWQCTEEQLGEIRGMGHELQFLQQERDALPCEAAWVEGVICNALFLHHPIEDFVNLRFIQLTSAGYDRVPMEYIRAHGIEIRNARGVYSIPMAEFALCGVLQLYKQSRFFAENQKQHKWEKHRGLLELCGKTVLIVGCGNVGTECAKRFDAMGCHVVGVDLVKAESPYFETVAGLAELDRLIPQADVIVLSLPLTEQSRQLMNADRLAKMKPTAVLVNIARGGLVDTAALIKAVDKIGGAVLDVFEDEPLAEDSALWEKKNVIVTPHNSFVGEGNKDRLFKIIREILKWKTSDMPI